MKPLTHLQLYRPNSRNCDLRVARTSLSSPFVGFLRKNLRLQWERKEAASLGSRSRVWLHSEAERESRERGRERGKERGAHLHAEPQSDCGAHRQLARFVPSFLNRRHWDSARKVKTDFSPRVLTLAFSPPCQWRLRRISRPLLSVSYSALSFSSFLQPLFPLLSPVVAACCCVSPPYVISTLLRDFRSSLHSLNSSIEWISSCRTLLANRVVACNT